MPRRLLIAVLFLLGGLFLSLPERAWSGTNSARSWLYAGVSYSIDQNFSFLLMPGHKYEYWREGSQELGTFLYELFAGPTYSWREGPFVISLPLWYYYLGFPYRPTDGYHQNHNIAFSPKVSYKGDKWHFFYRLFSYHTLYSGYYDSPSLRHGYSLMTTHTLSVSYPLAGSWRWMAANELFVGTLEDGEAPPTSGAGFFRKGVTKNKLYVGVKGVVRSFWLKVNYVLESHYRSSGKHYRTDHYLYTMILYMI